MQRMQTILSRCTIPKGDRSQNTYKLDKELIDITRADGKAQNYSYNEKVQLSVFTTR